MNFHAKPPNVMQHERSGFARQGEGIIPFDRSVDPYRYLAKDGAHRGQFSYE